VFGDGLVNRGEIGMKSGREEEVARHLESETPDAASQGGPESLRDLARLAELIMDDAQRAVRCQGEECRNAIRDIQRKVDMLHGSLLRRAEREQAGGD
jgi:hypothetical protein